MGKNIVVFSDGTGQEGGEGHSSNVYRLFHLVEDRTSRQIAFYDRGLGTGWRQISGKVAGAGISQNIQECYRFIFDNYQVGDRIFLFGFSRGAYTVRSLSGFIQLFGMLPSSRPELIKKAYSLYKIKDPTLRKEKIDSFKSAHPTIELEIDMIGVWDTVGALGIPIKWLDLLIQSKNEFHETDMAANVRAGYHAISIDDERSTFSPTLWDERQKKAHQKIEQVFFPGVHTDVGGGYEERGLSNISLNWMIKSATSEGLLLRDPTSPSFPENPNETINDSRSGLGRVYRKKVRHLTSGEITLPPKVHDSVCKRANYKTWIHQHNICK